MLKIVFRSLAMLQGNAIVGQSGGPTSVINSSLCGVVQGCFELGQKYADSKIDKVIGIQYGDARFKLRRRRALRRPLRQARGRARARSDEGRPVRRLPDDRSRRRLAPRRRRARQEGPRGRSSHHPRP